MSTIRLKEKDIYRGSLILVNQENPMRTEVRAADMAAAGVENTSVLLEKRTASILRQTFDALAVADQIVAVSGFRSRREQEEIYRKSMLENGEEFTRKYVALPDCSEHQIGMAVDLAENRPEIDFICPDFPYAGICQRFREAAVHFGFIERYPKGKEEITGIAQEPWHFRYVGFPHSLIMQEKSMVLEEYIDYLRGFPFGKRPFRYMAGGTTVEIGYVPMLSELEISAEIPDDQPCLISGNNVDGFIITLWRMGS